jgi:hypothetical protein
MGRRSATPSALRSGNHVACGLTAGWVAGRRRGEERRGSGSDANLGWTGSGRKTRNGTDVTSARDGGNGSGVAGQCLERLQRVIATT